MRRRSGPLARRCRSGLCIWAARFIGQVRLVFAFSRDSDFCCLCAGRHGFKADRFNAINMGCAGDISLWIVSLEDELKLRKSIGFGKQIAGRLTVAEASDSSKLGGNEFGLHLSHRQVRLKGNRDPPRSCVGRGFGLRTVGLSWHGGISGDRW